MPAKKKDNPSDQMMNWLAIIVFFVILILIASLVFKFAYWIVTSVFGQTLTFIFVCIFAWWWFTRFTSKGTRKS